MKKFDFNSGKILLVIVAFFILYACESDATKKIKGKRLNFSIEKEQVKLGEPVLIRLKEAADSVQVTGIDPQQLVHRETSIELDFRNVGRKKVEITAFYKKEQKKAVANVRVTAPQAPEERSFEIVETLPHNPAYYTQGLEFKNGKLYESRGQQRESAVYRLSFPSLKVEKEVKLSDEEFGEGLTFWGDTLYQLTWRSRKATIYDSDLNKITSMPFPLQEGWGICFDGEKLLASDGSHILYSLNKNLEVQGRQEIYAGNSPLDDLNELEFVKGKIVANKYHSDKIYFIDPTTGVTEASVDFSRLREYLTNPRSEVLNGIAYLTERDLFFITGKLWDKAFLVKMGKGVKNKE